MYTLQVEIIAMKNLKYILVLLIVLLAFWLGSFFQNTSVKNTSASSAQNSSLAKEWSCSMHPQIRQSKSGKCPLCGMDLIPLKDAADKTTGPSELKLSVAAEKLAEIETSPVERKFATVEIRMIGMIAFDEETMAFITIVSLLPVFVLTGAEGKLFKPLSYTKTFALFASIFVALTVLPALAHVILKKRTMGERLKTAAFMLLIAIGVATGIFWHFWAGVPIVIGGVIMLSEPLVPESYKSWIHNAVS